MKAQTKLEVKITDWHEDLNDCLSTLHFEIIGDTVTVKNFEAVINEQLKKEALK